MILKPQLAVARMVVVCSRKTHAQAGEKTRGVVYFCSNERLLSGLGEKTLMFEFCINGEEEPNFTEKNPLQPNPQLR